MRKAFALMLVCLLALCLTGCAGSPRLPFTEVQLGMGVHKAQELEPELEAELSRFGTISALVGGRRDFAGVTGSMTFRVKNVDNTDDGNVIGQIRWDAKICSMEREAPDFMFYAHRSETPGEDARALYQQLVDAVSQSIGAKPNQTNGEDKTDGSKFNIVNFWNIGEDILVSCEMRNMPTASFWAEEYDINCIAMYTIPR